MVEGRFASVCSVEEFILEQENKNTAQKTERDVRLLERYLKTKDEDRKLENISAVELNEYVSQFIISVRIKDGTEYEPTSLRSLIARFERHLKKKGYSASKINDLVFEKTRKVLKSKEKQLKRQVKGNKPNASVALKSEEFKVMYDKGLLGMCSPEALLDSHWRNNTLHFGLR